MGLEAEDPFRLQLEEESFELGSLALEDPPFVLVEVQAPDNFTQDDSNTEGASSPPEMLLDLLLDENGDSKYIAFANNPTDPDGVIRRAKIYFRQNQAEGQKKPANFAFLLLEHLTGEAVTYDTKEGQSVLLWQGRSVPPHF